MIVPTVGRIVLYYPLGKSQKDDPRQQPCAAQVAYVLSDRLVNLGYLTPHGEHQSARSVPLVQEGDPYPVGPFCEWMPFQIGQAKQAQPAA